jgi:choline transport protein
MVAPPRFKAVFSYVVGWLSVFAWWMLAAGSAVFCAQVVASLATVYNPDFAATRWQIYLIYVALTLLTTALITFFPRQLPRAEIFFFWLSIVGFVVSTITVLARSSPKQTGNFVFGLWNNQSGWNDGVAFMIGVGQGMFAFIAIDAATHVAEGECNSRPGVVHELTTDFHRNAATKEKRPASNGSYHAHRSLHGLCLDSSIHVCYLGSG